MDILTSNWSSVTSMPQKYVFPPDKRPGDQIFNVCNEIPIIDLKNVQDFESRAKIIQQILKASEEFGLFQVINHGVSRDQMVETMNLFKEFYNLPADYKAKFYSQDPSKSCRIYASTLDYENEEFHYWRDNFTHRCYPLEDHIEFWPEKPQNYREIVASYTTEARKLMLRILDLIGEGLGLEPQYFESELSDSQLLSVNHHVPCPEPKLTLGMPEHCDPTVISMLQQVGVSGFQILQNAKWSTVEPVTDAFLVLTGLQLRVISNGRFTSPKHRVVTHQKVARTTICNFLSPKVDHPIGPARRLTSELNPPNYRNYTYKEFINKFAVEPEAAAEHFKLQNQHKN